jgi:structural maintenance of chromosome 1
VLPPGKRFRDMELLSGGEQTLSALALLFAIQSFRATGFFILDEVDAALDSANVAQVARFVRKRAAAGLQFIVISHKERMYERGNSLVGVYRRNAIDSSRCLTLDLLAYEEGEVA